MDSHTILLKTK